MFACTLSSMALLTRKSSKRDGFCCQRADFTFLFISLLTMTFFLKKNSGRKTLLIEMMMMKRFDPSTDLDIVCSLLLLIPGLYHTIPAASEAKGLCWQSKPLQAPNEKWSQLEKEFLYSTIWNTFDDDDEKGYVDRNRVLILSYIVKDHP